MIPTPVAVDRRFVLSAACATLVTAGLADRAQAVAAGVFEDVRRHGARGNGTTIDSPAINRAIAAAARRGGGTVVVSPGRYLCFTLRLRDNIALVLSAGATIVAADPALHGAHYDPPENYLEEQFQDFGITHVHNSLIRGDGLTNIAILGPGQIHGPGLDREGPGDRWHGRAGFRSAAALGVSPRDLALRDPAERLTVGRANKAIGLMRCHGVRLDGFTILQGGHFAVIAHGCTGMQITGLVIDTDRDGIDIDGCRDVRILNCTVNAPKDDAIVLKSSYALGRAVPCEDILVSGCKTSGYAMGSLLDGSYRHSDYRSPDGLGVLGRIKLGTESNGGFRGVRISDCLCTNSRGILMGIVDGGTLEDVTISGIVLRDPVNHPLFVHHAARMRAPRGTPVGRVRRIRFENITISGANPRFACGVEGIADAPVEDVTFRGLDITTRGGGTVEDARRTPPYRRETSLEVSYLGTLPAAGLYARHARRLTIRDITLRTERPDERPVIALRDVVGANVDGIASSMRRDAVVGALDTRNVALGDTVTLDDRS